jgi:4-hydroxy 2-oxovalerate aldolase
MGSIHVDALDVTLRDGGYVNDHEFASDDVAGILAALGAGGIPYAEIGYYRPWHRPDDAPAAARTPAEHVARARQHLGDARLVCMVHPNQLEPQQLRDLAATGIDVVRFAASVSTFDRVAAHVDACNELGMLASINLIRASELDVDQIVACGRAAEQMGASWFYVADSNSGLYPDQVAGIFRPLHDAVGIRLGFHAHDGLRLAFANTLVAIEHGATLVDGSLGGMGKGGGNLPTELIAAHLAHHVSDRYLVSPLSAAVERYIQKWIGRPSACEATLSAILNLNIDQLGGLRKQAAGHNQTLLTLLEQRVRRPRRAPEPWADPNPRKAIS